MCPAKLNLRFSISRFLNGVNVHFFKAEKK